MNSASGTACSMEITRAIILEVTCKITNKIYITLIHSSQYMTNFTETYSGIFVQVYMLLMNIVA
jgi:hypothetical protein